MAKPSGSICNIDCSYCFYLEKEKLYPERNQNWRMDDETLEIFVKQQIQAQPGKHVSFAWQGGEPTLMGIDFFEKVVELCELYGKGKQIEHAFQTNGVLLNDQWCSFFAKNNFLIGVSIDGPAHLHDHYRVTRSGKPTHAKVMQGISYLKKHGVEFNTLTVVNAENVKHPLAVYQFLCEIGSTYLQFIPLVEREDSQANDDELRLVAPSNQFAKVTAWSLTPLQLGEFLNCIFDYWVQRDVGHIFVQFFDSTLASWLNQNPGICIFSETCGHLLALEANGDVYNCDHYVYPEHKLGNIHEKSISTMNRSEQAIAFGLDKKESLTSDCKQCDFRFACHGGCPKHRFALSQSGLPNQNYFCAGYKLYFEHTAKYMQFMLKLLKNNRPAAEIMLYLSKLKQHNARQSRLIGRNDLCNCGSGKKFKICCA